jgi:hypothetical protein
MTTSHEYEQNRFFSKKMIPIFVCFKMIKIVFNIKKAKFSVKIHV